MLCSCHLGVSTKSWAVSPFHSTLGPADHITPSFLPSPALSCSGLGTRAHHWSTRGHPCVEFRALPRSGWALPGFTRLGLQGHKGDCPLWMTRGPAFSGNFLAWDSDLGVCWLRLFAAVELTIYFLTIRWFQEKKSILIAPIKTVEPCNWYLSYYTLVYRTGRQGARGPLSSLLPPQHQRVGVRCWGWGQVVDGASPEQANFLPKSSSLDLYILCNSWLIFKPELIL